MMMLVVCLQPLGAQTVNTQAMYVRPTLLLFKLNESSTQIEAYRRTHNQEALSSVLEDDRQINRSIIADFKRNFKLCPIYFFYDRDYEAVKGHQWEQVTFYDFEHLESPKKIETSHLANYFIAEVDYPPVARYDTLDAPSSRRGSDLKGGDDYAAARDYCVILYDEDFNLLKGKIAVTNISLRKTGNIFKPAERQYSFSGAAALERVLLKFTRP